MASDFLKIDRTTQQGQGLGQCVDLTAQLLGQLRQRKAVMDHIASGGDWTTLGTMLGVTTAQAQSIYNLTAGALAQIDVFAVQAFCQQIG